MHHESLLSSPINLAATFRPVKTRDPATGLNVLHVIRHQLSCGTGQGIRCSLQSPVTTASGTNDGARTDSGRESTDTSGFSGHYRCGGGGWCCLVPMGGFLTLACLLTQECSDPRSFGARSRHKFLQSAKKRSFHEIAGGQACSDQYLCYTERAGCATGCISATTANRKNKNCQVQAPYLNKFTELPNRRMFNAL